MFVPHPIVMPSHLRKDTQERYSRDYSKLLNDVISIQKELSRQHDVEFIIPNIYGCNLEIGYFQNNMKRGTAIDCSNFDECISRVKQFYSTIL